jgi:hypothetical protein
MSREIAEKFVEALRGELEESRDVEVLVEIHTEECEVGTVFSIPHTFRGHDGLREFWTSYRSKFGEMRSEFRKHFRHRGAGGSWMDDGGHLQRRHLLLREGVSILEIEGGKVGRFMAYFDPRDLTGQVVA